MSTSRPSELPPLAQNSPSADTEQVLLLLSLTASPSARLTSEIDDILKDKFDQPYTLLGCIGKSLTLNVRLRDPGLVATELLARRLLKLKGVNKLKAERVCPLRGAIFAISLEDHRSPTG